MSLRTLTSACRNMAPFQPCPSPLPPTPPHAQFPMQPHLVPDCRTVREFDDYITVPCFGWPSTDAYYAGSSSSLSVPHVRQGGTGIGGMAWGWGWGWGSRRLKINAFVKRELCWLSYPPHSALCYAYRCSHLPPPCPVPASFTHLPLPLSVLMCRSASRCCVSKHWTIQSRPSPPSPTPPWR